MAKPSRHGRSNEPYISKEQIKLIKIGQKELALDDDAYRAMLHGLYGVTSCTQLSMRQASSLIKHMESLGFETLSSRSGASGASSGAPQEQSPQPKKPARKPAGSRPRSGGKVVHLASRAELNKIAALSYLVEWRQENGLHRWIEARFGLKKVKTAREAFTVIEALKGMISAAMLKQYGKDWWTKEYPDQGIMRFIKEHRPEEYR